MIITDISVTDYSTTADLRGNVAVTTHDGAISHFECHAMGQGSADAPTRRKMLMQAALDQLKRMPNNRRVDITLNLSGPLAA